MNTKIKWSGVFFLTTLFSITSTAALAQSILASAESGSQVPIEGVWVFPECSVNDDGEYELGKDIQEFLIFTGDQVEGRVVQYTTNDATCTGEETIAESETATVFSGGLQEDDTCWDGETPPRQDSDGYLADNPVATWLIYWLGEGETETGLFYIDDTAEPWYLWRYSGEEENGDEEENGGEENLTLESDCMFPLSSEEPLIKLSPATVSVTIDIKPGSDPNSVNPRSKGVIPVAVLGSIDFDAIQVDVSTVTFGPEGATPAHDGHVEDVNDDSFMDMMFHFKTQETGIVCGDTEAILNGATFDGTPITGSDRLTTVGCSKKDDEGPSLTFTPDEWTLTLDTAGPGIHTIFMIADVSPLAVNDVQDLGGKLIWAETQIELCADPTYPPDVWGDLISIREVGNGFLKIGDGFETSSDDCTINTTMQMAFDDFGLPNEACLSVRTGGVDFEYCAPLAVRTTGTIVF